MTRFFDGDQPPLWQHLQQPLAFFERHGVVLFSPNHEHRPRMFSDALELFCLIDIAIADDLGQPCTTESFVLHLIAIAFSPIRESFGVKKIAKLAVGPISFIEQSGEIVPYWRDVFNKR